MLSTDSGHLAAHDGVLYFPCLRLPADPRFARTGSLQSQCITSPVSLKDVVMARACSKNQEDLNRDPAVRRTYRRNKAGRLESMDVPAPSGSAASVSPPILNARGKRQLSNDSECDATPLKRRRTSNDIPTSDPMRESRYFFPLAAPWLRHDLLALPVYTDHTRACGPSSKADLDSNMPVAGSSHVRRL